MGGVQASATRVPLMISCLLANYAWDFKDHELNTTHASHCKIQVCSTYTPLPKWGYSKMWSRSWKWECVVYFIEEDWLLK
jgi:hypothetical protein